LTVRVPAGRVAFAGGRDDHPDRFPDSHGKITPMRPTHLVAPVLIAVVLATGALLAQRRARDPAPQASRSPAPAPIAARANSPSAPGEAVRPVAGAKLVQAEPAAPILEPARRLPSPVARAEAPVTTAHDLAPAEGGMIVELDPETGQYTTPSPQRVREIARLQAEAVSKSDEGLRILHGPNGAVGVDLAGRSQDYATVTIGPSGKKTFGCYHKDGVHTPACKIPMPAPLEEE
jgi:hypothetical protein